MPRIALGTARTLAPVLLAAVTPVADTSLNGPIGRQRRYAVARTEMPAMIPHLPIEIVDPVERLLAAHQRIARHRTRGEPEAEQSLLRLAGWLPFGLVEMVFRLASWFPQRGVAAFATNIPGPRHRLTLGGRDVLEMWPCIPIAMRVRTTIAILSYGDALTFGITGDRDTAPDLDAIASGIATEIAVLLAHARGQRPRRRLELVRNHAISSH